MQNAYLMRLKYSTNYDIFMAVLKHFCERERHYKCVGFQRQSSLQTREINFETSGILAFSE